MKITTSKNKTKVISWAKRNGRPFLWQDKDDVWHAAIHSFPLDAIATEKLDVVSKPLPLPPANHIGAHLRYFRESAGMTQKEVAAKTSR